MQVPALVIGLDKHCLPASSYARSCPVPVPLAPLLVAHACDPAATTDAQTASASIIVSHVASLSCMQAGLHQARESLTSSSSSSSRGTGANLMLLL